MAGHKSAGSAFARKPQRGEAHGCAEHKKWPRTIFKGRAATARWVTAKDGRHKKTATPRGSGFLDLRWN
jgi:hypothetical protein